MDRPVQGRHQDSEVTVVRGCARAHREKEGGEGLCGPPADQGRGTGNWSSDAHPPCRLGSVRRRRSACSNDTWREALGVPAPSPAAPTPRRADLRCWAPGPQSPGRAQIVPWNTHPTLGPLVCDTPLRPSQGQNHLPHTLPRTAGVQMGMSGGCGCTRFVWEGNCRRTRCGNQSSAPRVLLS